VFDASPNERLTKWKQFRDNLENSKGPFEDVAEFWSHAPFVSDFLAPQNPNSWPDPWHLILDGRFDDLAIVLGMLYTLQLTQRFIGSHFEIHMSIVSQNKSPNYWLVVDGHYALNYHYKEVVAVEQITGVPTTILYTTNSLQ
jgi:hypothetical protein